MFGDTQPVIDRTIAAGGKETSGGAQFRRVNAGQQRRCLRRVAGVADEFSVMLEFVPVAALAYEFLIHQPLGHNHMRKGADHGDIRAGAQGQMMRRRNMRRFHQINPPWVDHDQLRTRAQSLLKAACKDRVAIRGIGPDHHNHICMLNRVEILRARACSKPLTQTIARGRMTNARASIGVVVAKNCARQFLHHVGFFVGAAA